MRRKRIQKFQVVFTCVYHWHPKIFMPFVESRAQETMPSARDARSVGRPVRLTSSVSGECSSRVKSSAGECIRAAVKLARDSAEWTSLFFQAKNMLSCRWNIRARTANRKPYRKSEVFHSLFLLIVSVPILEREEHIFVSNEQRNEHRQNNVCPLPTKFTVGSRARARLAQSSPLSVSFPLSLFSFSLLISPFLPFASAPLHPISLPHPAPV